MNNIDNSKEYIQDSVINPLERLMGNDVDEVSVFEKYYHREGFPPKDSIYRSLLHEMMLPYYEMYLNGDTRICCVGIKLESIRYKMEHAIDEDDQFGSWASEQDLIAAAECWGDNLKRFEYRARLFGPIEQQQELTEAIYDAGLFETRSSRENVVTVIGNVSSELPKMGYLQNLLP